MQVGWFSAGGLVWYTSSELVKPCSRLSRMFPTGAVVVEGRVLVLGDLRCILGLFHRHNRLLEIIILCPFFCRMCLHTERKIDWIFVPFTPTIVWDLKKVWLGRWTGI